MLEELFPPVLAVLRENLLQQDKEARRVTAPGVSVFIKQIFHNKGLILAIKSMNLTIFFAPEYWSFCS